MYVGFGGGRFNATGGAAASGELQVGVAAGVAGAVSVDTSTWTNGSNVVVGVAGTGTLAV
jgi:T5SS/PEP-CTERM-associated repeat protein